MDQSNQKDTYEKPELKKHSRLREVTLSSIGSGDGDGQGKGSGNNPVHDD